MEYILVEDDDGHCYVIPAENEDAFDKWVATNGDEMQPIWVEEVGGSPRLVKFTGYRIE